MDNERDVALAISDDDEGNAVESDLTSRQVMSPNRDIAVNFIIDGITARFFQILSSQVSDLESHQQQNLNFWGNNSIQPRPHLFQSYASASGRAKKRAAAGQRAQNGRLCVGDDDYSQWRQKVSHLLQIQPKFFKSTEPKMEHSSRVYTDCIAYHGVSVCHQYSMDVREVRTFCSQRKPIQRGAAGAYTQICNAVGQFLRLAIVYGMISIYNVWPHGGSLKASCCRDLSLSKLYIPKSCFMLESYIFAAKGTKT